MAVDRKKRRITGLSGPRDPSQDNETNRGRGSRGEDRDEVGVRRNRLQIDRVCGGVTQVVTMKQSQRPAG